VLRYLGAQTAQNIAPFAIHAHTECKIYKFARALARRRIYKQARVADLSWVAPENVHNGKLKSDKSERWSQIYMYVYICAQNVACIYLLYATGRGGVYRSVGGGRITNTKVCPLIIKLSRCLLYELLHFGIPNKLWCKLLRVEEKYRDFMDGEEMVFYKI
jgi:hypothetical protein